MATSAFKSTTKRTPVTKTSYDSPPSNQSSSALRRSRSLGRFSRRLSEPAEDLSDEASLPRGRFVNTVRGSGLPEISLDDLAIKLFVSGERGRSAPRNDDFSPVDELSVSQRRERSLSRHGLRVGDGVGTAGSIYGGERVNSDTNLRKRRSVSVARYQISDSESDLDHSLSSSKSTSLNSSTLGNSQVTLSNMTAASNPRQGLRRSLSQKDFKLYDGYSSHSSAITDDEGRKAYSDKNGIERKIRTVYASKKAENPIATGNDLNSGLYEAMRNEFRNAVAEIKMELEQAIGKTNASAFASDDQLQSRKSDLQAVSTIRKSYAARMEQSEKRKQDLSAQMVLEEERGRGLSKIVKELLPDTKNTTGDMPSRVQKKSNDRSGISMRLTEEAEKYIEDFISNVEDTDISSWDGERSDTSSSLGGITRTETFQTPAISKCLPVEMDGIILPWLQWETSNDVSPLSGIKEPIAAPKPNSWDAAQEATPARDLSNYSISSHGSCNPRAIDGHWKSIAEVPTRKFGKPGMYDSHFSSNGTRVQYDVDDYLQRENDEDLLVERWRQRHRINSGSLLLCGNQMLF